jgi:hypothetical protein
MAASVQLPTKNLVVILKGLGAKICGKPPVVKILKAESCSREWGDTHGDTFQVPDSRQPATM